MAELKPIKGKSKILLFRLLGEKSSKKAAKLALQTEHEWSYERETDATQTKDGAIVSTGGLEVTLDISAVSSRDDVNKMLFRAVKEDLTLEVWEIDLEDNKSGNKYGAKYAQGKLNSWTLPDSVDGFEEISTTMAIDGVPVDGEATLEEDQKALIKAAYEFTDTTAG